MAEQKTICIAGATGLAGAYAVREALRRGHNVHATARDINRAHRLHEFPGAAGRLRLFEAHAERPESFVAPLVGADAVILACFPTPRSGRDGRAIAELEPGRAWRDVVAQERRSKVAFLDEEERRELIESGLPRHQGPGICVFMPLNFWFAFR